MSLRSQHSLLIKKIAQENGFDACGISIAGFLEQEAPKLENWLKLGKQGEMDYMSNYFDKRLDPRILVPGAKSVISLLLNYFPKRELDQSDFKIAKYAYGQDYHLVIKEKLVLIWEAMRLEIGALEGRIFVDSAPVLEKAWAVKSGLGWLGKNTNLIAKKQGSFFFIAEIICDLDLEPDHAVTDYCGTCTRCIDACPTEAITEPYQVDGSKCISYLTIELKNAIPLEFKDKMDSWVFGCDVCQDVCPWNRFSKPHQTPTFDPNLGLQNMQKQDWIDLTEEVFKEVFAKSAVKRTKIKGLKRNVSFLLNPHIQS